MSDFWISSGHHLLDRDTHGHLLVSDDFLKALLARPEIVPPEEACPDERALHGRLLAAPREAVAASDVAIIKDKDAQENWQVFLRFRDLLLQHPSLEAAYLAHFRRAEGTLPWLFINQLVHLILRNALDGEGDVFVLRAAEMFFRAQKFSLHDGALLLADADLVEDRQATAHASPLLAMFQEVGHGQLDILSSDNANDYIGRSDAFDMVLDFQSGGLGRAALARVIEIWVKHLLGVDVRVEPLTRLEGERWSWFVGLDQEATAIGNALWEGKEPSGGGRERILGLFKMVFQEPHLMIERVRGEAVYLILAAASDGTIQVKPQNLVTGLPLMMGREGS